MNYFTRYTYIAAAKQYSKRTGKSLSQMFEEYFDNVEASGKMKSEKQAAAERLLKVLEVSKPVQTRDDEQLLKDHVARKFA